MIERFPLSWPAGYPVTQKRVDSAFKIAFVQARDEMINELKLLIGYAEVKNIIISCNMPHNKDGLLTGKMPLMYPNPGVAVYFKFNGEDKVIACDHWTHLHANLRAIGLTVAAIRSMDRYKCTDILSRAMGDMKALPQNAGAAGDMSWWVVLGVKKDAPWTWIEKTYRDKIKIFHPDMKPNGDADVFNMVQKAYQEAKVAFGVK